MSKADGLSVKQWQDDVIKGVCVCYGLVETSPFADTSVHWLSYVCMCVYVTHLHNHSVKVVLILQ